MKVYFTSADNLHQLLNSLLTQELGEYEIIKNEYGKPYVRGNAIYFSLSHSAAFGLLALSDKPVGADIEVLRGRDRSRLIKYYSENERAEIKNEADFLRHFTAREAYIKNIGSSLFTLYKRLSFEGGYILLDGIKQDQKIKCFEHGGCIISLCGEGDVEIIEC